MWRAVTPQALRGLVLGTQYGQVWLLRLVLMLLVGGILVLSRRTTGTGRNRHALRLTGAGLAAGVLVAGAFTGHPASADRAALLVWQVSTDAIHLLAAGTWLGGLPLLALLLGWARRTSDPAAEEIAVTAVRRFSVLAVVSVTLLVSSGFASAWALVGSIPGLVGTPYGRLLLLKIALLLPLLGLGAANLWREKPRLAEAGGAAGRRQEALRRLRRNVLAEAALGGMVLLVVGWLGITPPARHVDPVWPFPFRLSLAALSVQPRLESLVGSGVTVVFLGLVTFVAAARFRRARGGAVLLGGAAVVWGLSMLWPARAALVIDAYPTTYLRPAVRYEATSVASGLRIYREQCAVCHGMAGNGNGPAARGLDPKPANLMAGHTGDHTAGDLFWWITHGIPGSAMPAFGERVGADERWDVINFVRTLAAAEAARPMGPSVEPEVRVVAPDFAYYTATGEAGTLRDFQGRAVVLLVFFSLPDSGPRLIQLEARYQRLRQQGAEVLAVPLPTGVPVEASASPALALPHVADGGNEIAATYGLFRRDLTPEGLREDPPAVRHVEFLIDRQSYVRARWIPGGGSGWTDLNRLAAEVDRLNQEPPRPAPDEHVH